MILDLNWAQTTLLLYSLSLPPTYAIWVVWRKRNPKFTFLEIESPGTPANVAAEVIELRRAA
jgi:hypothetical protein